MRINTNVSSLTAQEASQNTSKRITSSLEKLSTGLRINKASDDASGLAIADKLRTQATSINQGIANGNSAVSLLQIADKSMGEQSNILDTIKSKLIQANTDTTSADGREAIRKDISKLLEQLDNIAEQTNYNGNVLLQKTAGDSAEARSSSNQLNFQIGETSNDIITNATIQSNTTGLGSSVTYSAANDNNTITAGSTMTLASSGAISLTSTKVSGENQEETVSLSGDIDVLELKVGMTISGMDSLSKAEFEDKMGTVGIDYSQSGSTYTMLKDKTFDLSVVSGTKTANITTPAEGSSIYAAEQGDIINISSLKDGSALSNALSGPSSATNFKDNLDGTYTVKAGGAGNYTLETGEDITYDRASTNNTFTAGQTITLTSNVTANSELAKALSGANFSHVSGTGVGGAAGTTGAQYTVNTTTSNVGIDANEDFTVYTPVDVAYAIGDTIDTTGGTVVSGSALHTALHSSAFTDNGDGSFTATAASTVKLAATENIDLYEKTTLSTTFSFGDTVSVNNTDANALKTGSDLKNLLTDATKFQKTTSGSTDYYKYIGSSTSAQSIDLEAKESVNLLKATSNAIGTAKENSTLTLTSDVIAGSDLDLQLKDTNLFTLTSAGGTAGKSGATYTVKPNFSTDSVKTIQGEGFTITAPQTIGVQTLITGATANSTLITDTITFTPDDGTATTNYDVDTGTTPANVGKIITEGAADDSAQATFSKSGFLSIGLSYAGGGTTPNAAAATFGYAVGDKISIGSITDGATGSNAAEVLESGKWELVSGSGNAAVYQATATGTFTFNDAADTLTLQKKFTAANPTSSTANTATATLNNDKTDKTASAAAPISGTTESIRKQPSETVNVTFTTNSKVNVTNNGLATDTLTISGNSEITNGGTQLSSLGALGAGELTQAKAAEFQTVIDDAITDLNSYRGDIGSTQNQVESAVRNLMTQATNVKAAESIIRDVDYAAESANFNKQNIISQAGSYAISQSNAVQQNVLRLLQ